MNVDRIIQSMKSKLAERLGHFNTELSKIRSGRVSPSLVEHVKVEAYNSLMPLNQIATLSTPDPKCIAIEPWDKSLMESVEKALLKADLGVTPANDGHLIRLNFPPLSEERRKEMVKVVKKQAEDTKIAFRTIRREALDELNKHKKEISEDDIKRHGETIQKELSAQEQKINDITEKKSAELLKI